MGERDSEARLYKAIQQGYKGAGERDSEARLYKAIQQGYKGAGERDSEARLYKAIQQGYKGAGERDSEARLVDLVARALGWAFGSASEGAVHFEHFREACDSVWGSAAMIRQF
jgi:hypothetical protein